MRVWINSKLASRLLDKSSAIVLALAAGIAIHPSETLAQTDSAPPAAKDAGASTEELVVTGSRIARSSYNSPTPVNILARDKLQNIAVSNIGDALNEMPSFRALTTPTTNLYRTPTNIAARNMDLRGLGASRTLVLVDGRRFVPGSELGTVDINAIPSSLISRAEVVTGGASAAYGADAVAGVVNLILDSKYDGIRGEVSYGQTEKNDAKQVNTSFEGGTSFAAGRGHTVIAGEFVDEGASGDCFSRDWCAHSINLISNPTPGVNGQPATLLANEVWVITNRSGVIQSGPLAGTTFDNNGNPIPFHFGTNVSGSFMIGGDPSVGRSLYTEKFPLQTPDQHYSAFSHTDYDLSDSLTATVELSYSVAKGGPAGGSDQADIGRTITIDNAYLPAATHQAMINAGITSFGLNRYDSDVGPIVGTSDNKTFRGMFGLKGRLPWNWNWDAYYQYGETDGRVEVANDRNLTRWGQAWDAVLNSSNQIVCRVTLTDPTSLCVPFNPFGPSNGSKAAIAWAVGTAWQTRTITQHVAELNVRGDLFDLWAGPVSSALGVSYRHDHSEGNADPLSQAGGWSTQGGSVLPSGGQEVKEVYAEFNVPLLHEAPLAKSLEVDAAGRHTEYSQSGNADTWKVGLVYRPIDQIMVRITRSSDIRAPSALELNPTSTRTNLNINDPQTHSTYFVDTYAGGNPKLGLEKAETTTYGIVLQPSFLPSFRLSADYYDISVKNAIDVLSPQGTLDICARGNAFVCSFVTRDAGGLITRINAVYQNLSTLKSKGLEIVADYSIDLADITSWIDGKVDISVNATHADELSTTDAFGFKTQYAGWTGNPGTVQNVLGIPKWRYNLLATYSLNRYALSLNGRYIGDGVYDPTKVGPGQPGYDPTKPNSINYNSVASRFYVDATGKFNVTDHVQLFASIINLANQDPPRERLYGNPVLFDGIGRRYTVGIRANW